MYVCHIWTWSLAAKQCGTINSIHMANRFDTHCTFNWYWNYEIAIIYSNDSVYPPNGVYSTLQAWLANRKSNTNGGIYAY